MDFARKQLEKYGWSDGKGLGKHENGISEALKPKLKRSVTGVGHDPASEFNEHWWSALYDKAAKNVEVEDRNGRTKKIKTKDSDNFVISSSTWQINRKPSKQTDEALYSAHFVRTAVLTNDKGGRKTENVKESESEDEVDKKDIFQMTDEELFAACEGRTAHKGARHGLRAIGKLARIAEQEKKLLTQPQYAGYSHAKMLKLKAEEKIDEMTLEDDQVDVPVVQKKKKKRKRCTSDKSQEESKSALPEKILKLKRNRDAIENINNNNGRQSEEPMSVDVDDIFKVKKSKKKKREIEEVLDITDCNDATACSESKIKKKKKKKEKNEQMNNCLE